MTLNGLGRLLVTSLSLFKIMKLIKNISLSVMMVFLFSLPQYSIASKKLQQIPNKITGNHFAKEVNRDYCCFAFKINEKK